MKTAVISAVRSTVELLRAWCEKYGIELALCEYLPEGRKMCIRDSIISRAEHNI